MKLVLGTVQFGLAYGINNSLGKPSTEKAFSIMDKAYELGIDEIDTADAYGDAAEVLYTYFKTKAQPFKVMSKFSGAESFSSALEKSCQRLGVSSLEGYYFHRFEDFKSFKEFEDVRKMKALGKLKNLGVSLYSLEQLKLAVETAEVDVIQLPFNIFDRSDEKIALLKKARRNNKRIYVRSIFLQGLFFKDINTLPSKLEPLKQPLNELKQIVDSYNLNIEDLCLNFANQQEYIDKIVIGVDTVEQLQKNVGSLNAQISPEAIQAILKIQINEPELLNPVNWNP